ncbi:MAG: stage II sporulation protein P [Clostridia bacterium]|nr:stage II sporulation protein P [Clostridia bacterium]
MQKWISIVLIVVLCLSGGIFWESWLPGVAEFTLRSAGGHTARQMTLTLLKYTDPVMKQIGRYMVPEFTESLDENFLYFAKVTAEEEELPDDDAVKAANLSALSGTYHQVNGTAVANATDYDVSGNLNDTIAMPSFTEGEPAILIYHTHTTECYRNSEGISNTEDETKNVVAVGAAMAEVFEAAGYKTVHLTDIYNEDFNNAYSTSRAAVEQVLKQYPSIQVVLDVHRDAISSNGVDYYPVTEVDGKEAAQVMLVCGTDSKGLSHPNWRNNFTYALALSRKMGTLYGQLSRPVNLRRDRFNTHFTDYTLLLEVGSAANTLSQAVYGGQLTAKAMISLWNGT